jgi:hypothetical protein
MEAEGPELSELVHWEKGGRPRNLRKKSAPADRDSLEDNDDEDLASVREAIAAARIREARRAAGVNGGMPRGGGGGGWPNDGFVQWQAAADAQASHPKASSLLGSPARSPTRQVPESPMCEVTAARDGGSPARPPADDDWREGLEQASGPAMEWDRLDAAMETMLQAMGLRAEMTEKGRAIIAARPFKAGAIIIEQEPLAWALFPHGQQVSKWAETTAPSHGGPATVPINAQRCHYCLRTHANLRRCASCKYAHYCCAAHQKGDWPSHSAECTRRAKGNPTRAPTAMVTMLAQVHDVKQASERPKPPPPPPTGLSRPSFFFIPKKFPSPSWPPTGRRLVDLETLAAHYSSQPPDRLTGFAQVFFNLIFFSCCRS